MERHRVTGEPVHVPSDARRADMNVDAGALPDAGT
jgi:hypothetical protein